jgi:hypothetical protein
MHDKGGIGAGGHIDVKITASDKKLFSLHGPTDEENGHVYVLQNREAESSTEDKNSCYTSDKLQICIESLTSSVLAEKFSEKHECRVHVKTSLAPLEGICEWKGAIKDDHINVVVIDPIGRKYHLSGPTGQVAGSKYVLQGYEAKLFPAEKDDPFSCYVSPEPLELCIRDE